MRANRKTGLLFFFNEKHFFPSRKITKNYAVYAVSRTSHFVKLCLNLLGKRVIKTEGLRYDFPYLLDRIQGLILN